MSRLTSLRSRVRELAGNAFVPAAAALVCGVLATATVALAASVALDPAGAEGRAAYEYRSSPVVEHVAPNTVTAAEVAAAGRGTPGAALLRWWQTMQLPTPTARGLEHLAAPSSASERRRLLRQLSAVRYLFAESKPRLIDHEQTGERARLLVVIARADSRAPDGEVHQLEQFDLVRVGGRWQIGPRFIHRRYAAERAFARAAAERRR